MIFCESIVPWVCISPDLNAIEDIWRALRNRLKKTFRKLRTRARSEEELIVAVAAVRSGTA